MKKLLFAVISALSLTSLSAQEIKHNKIETLGRPQFNKHEWSVEANISLAQFSTNAIWHYNFTRWFNLGAGTGLSYIPTNDNLTANIFGRVGFIIPGKRVSPYLTTDLGYLFSTNGANPDYLLFMYPNFGLSFVMKIRISFLSDLVSLSGFTEDI